MAVVGMVVVSVGLAVLAGVGWVVFAPSGSGTLVRDTVRYPGLDDPRAGIQALFAGICAGAGLLTGVVALGLGEKGLARRCIGLILGSVPLAGITYLVGFLLGPPTEAAQVAAGAITIQPAFVLSTPLLLLVWPMVASMVVAVGMLMSLIIRPPARAD